MNTPQPSISIIIPAYNTEKYIVACLESVFAQEPNPDQVIIINDGSTDRTGSIVDAYNERPTVTILHTENKGPGLARNLGMGHVHTQYVHFLDSDDLLAPDFMAKAKKLIHESDYADLILFAGMVIDEAGTFIKKAMPFRQSHTFGINKGSKKSIVRQMYDANVLFSVVHTFGISKSSTWINNNIKFPKYYYEDEAILFPLVSSIDSVYVTDEIMYLRRQRQSSIMMTTKSHNHALGALTVALSTLSYYENHKEILSSDRLLWENRISNFTIYYIRICREMNIRISRNDILMIVYRIKSPKLLLRVLYNLIRPVTRSE